MKQTFTRAQAIAGMAAVASAPTTLRAAGLDRVSIGLVATTGSGGLYIAQGLGYFKEQGIEVKFVPFNAGAPMIAPLGAGQLDVGAGGPSAGLYNAISRGIDIKLVADHSNSVPPYSYAPILVRKSLVASGQVKSFKDFRGLNVAEPAPGTPAFCELVAALQKGGLGPKDVHQVYMGFPDQMGAFANGAIDASISAEPTTSHIIESGVAVRFATNADVYPGQQLSAIMYSDVFIKERPDVARRFMIAYVKAARDYNDALKDGHYAGPFAPQLIALYIKNTPLKDPAVYRKIVASGLDPNPLLHVDSLRKDLATYKEFGLVTSKISIDQCIDQSFVEAAIKAAGPYQPRARA